MAPKVGSQIKGTSRRKKEAMHASPSIVPVEATSTLRISSLLAYNLLSEPQVIL
jgi:hypothetical protein